MAESKEREIWEWFKANTRLTDESIAGIMGNFEAESNCEPCRVQSDFTAERTLSNAYASDVDKGIITAANFAFDGRGWGLYQLTLNRRKKGFLAYCKAQGYSISALAAQLEYFVVEMETDFSSLWSALLTCRDISTAASRVCREFERPAEVKKNSIARSNFGKGFFAEFHDEQSEPDFEAAIREEIKYHEERLQALNALLKT